MSYTEQASRERGSQTRCHQTPGSFKPDQNNGPWQKVELKYYHLFPLSQWAAQIRTEKLTWAWGVFSGCHRHEHSMAMSAMVVLPEFTDLVLFGLVILKQEGAVTSSAKFRHLHCTSKSPLHSAERKKILHFQPMLISFQSRFISPYQPLKYPR